MGALLDDRGAFAVVLAEDEERAALHAGGGEVGERIRGDIRADSGLEGDCAAHRVVDGGAEHGRGAGFVGVGFDVHAELIENVARVVQHVHDVRNGSALVAADIGDAGLEQGLGHGEDGLAVEGFAFAELEFRYFLFE
jgi:hypothetical protein